MQILACFGHPKVFRLPPAITQPRKIVLAWPRLAAQGRGCYIVPMFIQMHVTVPDKSFSAPFGFFLRQAHD
jgi:hypothetical protein